MKSIGKKGLLLIGIAIVIIVAAKATMFYGGSHPYMKQMQGEVSQLQQKFHSGADQAFQRMEGRGQKQHGIHPDLRRPDGREHPYFAGKGHRGGFWLGSLLTIAFWGGLLILAITWFKKRRTKQVGSNIAWESIAPLPIETQASTNASFLDQWEKEQAQLKEDK